MSEQATQQNPEQLPNEESVGEAFGAEMGRLGFEAQVLQGQNNPFPDQLDSLVLIDQTDTPSEPTVRLYRGVNTQHGGELAHQVCYLLKQPVYQEGSFSVDHTELEGPEAFAAVEHFADTVSYRSMVEMAEATNMSSNDRRFVNNRIKDMQLSMLRYPDRTLLEELEFQHVAAPGGTASQDLSPFVATSTKPEAAYGYGRNVMVLDVPASQVAGKGEDNEALVMGEIKPEWITALASFKYRGEQASADAVAAIAKELGGDETDVDLAAIRAASTAHALSAQNREADIADINVDLIESLLETTGSDAGELQEAIAKAGVLTYKDALWQAADYYIKKRAELYGRPANEAHTMFDQDEVDVPKFPGLHEPKPRVLNADAVHHLAQRYHHESSRLQGVAA